jgi:hypothetical protein
VRTRSLALPLLAAKVEESRLAVLEHWSHLAGCGVRLDQELPRWIVAKALGLAVWPGENEEAFLFVVLEARRGPCLNV